MQRVQFAGGGKRWRATAVQDAGALADDDRTARSVLDCASPLALFFRKAENKLFQRDETKGNGAGAAQPGKLRRRTIGTEKILIAPGFRDDTGTLGTIFVGGSGRRELLQLHAIMFFTQEPQ